MKGANLAYLLSTRDKLIESVFAAMLRGRNKNGKIVAARYNFTLYVDLNEGETEFTVRSTRFKFANSFDPILAEMLQLHNNKVLSTDSMVRISNELESLGVVLNAYQLVSVFTVAALIKLYKGRGHKYVFVPVIINYGAANLYHQTALVISYDGGISYYEPYGVYSKRGKSYRNCMCDLFSIFGAGIDTGVKCSTFHETLGVFGRGIQQIILEKNNQRESAFNSDYNSLVRKLKDAFPHQDFYNNESDPQDKTFKILGLLIKLDLYKTDVEKYDELRKEAIRLYSMYNSKTCVSITLIEMMAFFDGKDLSSLYDEFEYSDTPNNVLIKKLDELLEDIGPNTELAKAIKKKYKH